MLPPATITDRDSLSASSPHHARTRRSAPLYSRRLVCLLVAFAFALLQAPPLNAQTLPAPQNFQVSSTGLLTWDPVEGATHYILYDYGTVRFGGGRRAWFLFWGSTQPLPSSVTSFQLITGDSNYRIRMTAWGANGESPPTNEIDLSQDTTTVFPRWEESLAPIRNVRITWDVPYPRPTHPHFASFTGENTVHVTWDAVSGAALHSTGISYVYVDNVQRSGVVAYHTRFDAPGNQAYFVQDPGAIATFSLTLRARDTRGRVSPLFSYTGEAHVDVVVARPPRRVQRVAEPPPRRVVSPNETIAHNEQVIDRTWLQGEYAIWLADDLAQTTESPRLRRRLAIRRSAIWMCLHVADISGHAEQGIYFCFPQVWSDLVHAVARH